MEVEDFLRRYLAHGRPTTEENIGWERLRSPGVNASPYDLHVSDCLADLHPGDHFEIQWRKSKEFPYGWWYGVVGHLESCDGNKLYCQCHRSGGAGPKAHQTHEPGCTRVTPHYEPWCIISPKTFTQTLGLTPKKEGKKIQHIWFMMEFKTQG